MNVLMNGQRAGGHPQASDRYVNMEYNNRALLTSFFPDESPLFSVATRAEFSAAQKADVLNPVVKLIARTAIPISRIDNSSGRL